MTTVLFSLVLFFIFFIIFIFNYFDFKTKKISKFKLDIKLFFIILRTLVFFLIFIILFNPIFNFNKTEDIEPKIALLVDNSSSISNYGFDSIKIENIVNTLKSKLENVAKVDLLLFDKSLIVDNNIDLKGKNTNILEALNNLYELYFENNLTQTILVTDGNYNLGGNPSTFNKNFNIDVLLLGDTSSFYDFDINFLDYNPIAFDSQVNNINVNISATKANGIKKKLILYEFKNGNKNLLSSKIIEVNNNEFYKAFDFNFILLGKGLHHLQVEIPCDKEERNCNNNIKDFYIEVIDGTKNILILSESPHPDIAALRHIGKNFRNINIKSIDIKDFDGKISEFDLFIFYQLPTFKTNIDALYKNIIAAQKSILFVVGSNSNIQGLNNLQSIYKISVNNSIIHDVYPSFNKEFNNFTFDQVIINKSEKTDGFYSLYLNIEPLKSSNILFYQKIGNITTKNPLISFAKENYSNIGFIFAENIWKFKMNDYFKNKNFETFEDIFKKLLNYLSVKTNTKKLNCLISKQEFSNKESVIVEAFAFNTLHQSINNVVVNCEIIDENGVKKSEKMILNGDKYYFNFGVLSPSLYTVKVNSIIDGKMHTDTKTFGVKIIETEKEYKSAAFNEMNMLATNNNSKVYLLKDIEKLLESIKMKKFNSKLKSSEMNTFLIDKWYILFLILILLSIEWLLRKYFGK